MLFEFCLIALASGQMFKKVKLKDVDVLTLYQGKMTNGRRSSPVPQLSCRGGTAGCGLLYLKWYSATIEAQTVWMFSGNAKLTWTINIDSEKFQFLAKDTIIQMILIS